MGIPKNRHFSGGHPKGGQDHCGEKDLVKQGLNWEKNLEPQSRSAKDGIGAFFYVMLRDAEVT